MGPDVQKSALCSVLAVERCPERAYHAGCSRTEKEGCTYFVSCPAAKALALDPATLHRSLEKERDHGYARDYGPETDYPGRELLGGFRTSSPTGSGDAPCGQEQGGGRESDRFDYRGLRCVLRCLQG